VKALTIWQPWASLIMAGAKPFEFRGWKPPRSIVGQRIVIHAGAKAIDREGVEDLIDDLLHGGDIAAETCLHVDKALPILRRALDGQQDEGRRHDLFGTVGKSSSRGHGDLPWACGLGTAIVGEARLGPAIAAEFGLSRANDSDRDAHANWGWPMLDIELWEEPVPCRGAQGLWNWPDASSFARML
jgi:hypothetical protein